MSSLNNISNTPAGTPSPSAPNPPLTNALAPTDPRSRPERPERPNAGDPDLARPGITRLPDRVEISDAASRDAASRAGDDARAQRVDAIRRAIADGTYDADARLDTALDRLIEDGSRWFDTQR